VHLTYKAETLEMKYFHVYFYCFVVEVRIPFIT